ncbi:hypothetical protein K505DRAFT_293570 [Melanomma pulvis-pyrius CBS 109.77]|uniref:GCN5-related N-acetyltransferase Rv2170-like domain-containing protein n=1 Tax=Melanomma pulvis-pyrius CBS 109.77 TaxID=1314802 RepID=A0A6A6XWA3_9PLEO|nr:hypothetical protein K505DRAFT_293570 [Melanomma pulvis-pyrius CBS 109.77]
MSSFKVYTHAATSPLLARALKQSLPNSVNLTCRIQHSNRTPDARIIATFPEDGEEVPQCWAAAYLDRAMRPETELWIFAQGEVLEHSRSVSDSHDATQFCPRCRTAVLSLLDYLPTVPVPPIHPDSFSALDLAKQHEKDFPETGPDARYPISSAAYCRHLLDPHVVTLGACHEQIVQICTEVGLVREEFPGREARLDTFLFNLADLPQTRKLPEGLEWGELKEEDKASIVARIQIPRTMRLLLSLKNVGVFDEKTGKLVAWAFLGLDGSLTSLETEPEYRGKGIAKAVAAKVIGEYAPGLAVDEQGNAWANAQVYEGNVKSKSVCRSVGGRALWKTFWVRIDVSKAGGLAQSN